MRGREIPPQGNNSNPVWGEWLKIKEVKAFLKQNILDVYIDKFETVSYDGSYGQVVVDEN